jgi:hypothetical protein
LSSYRISDVYKRHLAIDPVLGPKLSQGQIFQGNSYGVIKPDQTYIGMTYSDYVQDYFNWLYSRYPDQQENSDLIFLRGNAIGDPYDDPKEDLLRSTLNILQDPRFVYDRTNLRRMTMTSNTSLFIDIFDTLFVVGDVWQGKELRTTYECRTAGREEFRLLSSAWATIADLNTGGAPGPLVTTLGDFYVESSPFEISVSPENKINRDPDYRLSGGQYSGVAVGLFLLIVDIQPGKYRIDFGGTQSLDYFTRSVIDVEVTKGVASSIPDSSLEIVRYPYPKPPRAITPGRRISRVKGIAAPRSSASKP